MNTEQQAREYFGLAEKWVSIDLVDVLPDRQRGVIPRHIKRLEENFDLRKLDRLRVTPLDNGRFSCNDGGQRLNALRALGWTHAPVSIGTGLTVEEECILFLEYNNGRAPVDAWEKYRIALNGRHPTAIRVTEMAEAAGMAIKALSKNPMEITPGYLVRSFSNTKIGEEGLTLVLQLLGEAFRADGAAFRLKFLCVLDEVIKRFLACPKMDFARLVCALHKMGFEKVHYQSLIARTKDLRLEEKDALMLTIKTAYNQGLGSNAGCRWK